MAINKTPVPDARLNMKIRSLFLDHLAQTANVSASAREAGVTSSAVYAERRRTPAFRDAWALALAEGYARLETDLLAEALQTPSGRTADGTRLSRFSRGLAASAIYAPAHAVGAQIVLIDASATLIISENMYQVGQSVILEAQGLGDATPVTTVIVAEGLAITPLPPVHGRVIKDDSGNFDLYWKRRSRLDLGLVDGVDQAQAEDQESYRVGLYFDDQMLREWTATENHLRISASEMASIGAQPNNVVVFKIQQIGRFALSDPLTFGLS